MDTPEGFIAAISDYDQLPILVARGEIALVQKLPPAEVGAKSVIVLRGGYRLMSGSSYQSISARLAGDVEDVE